jgi:hypothetical protein
MHIHYSYGMYAIYIMHATYLYMCMYYLRIERSPLFLDNVYVYVHVHYRASADLLTNFWPLANHDVICMRMYVCMQYYE